MKMTKKFDKLNEAFNIENEDDLIFYMEQKNIIVIELCPIEEIKPLN